MGVDAEANIFVGYNTEAIERFPSAARAQLMIDIEQGLVLGGGNLREFYCKEEFAGIGVELFDSHWDEGAKPIDLVALSAQAASLVAEMREYFKSIGVEEEPEVYIVSDMS
jgi:hypothetical protein